MRRETVAAISCLLLIFCYSDVGGAEWVPFQLSRTNDVWYYNSKTIIYPLKDTAEVLTKTVYSEEGKKVKKGQLVTAGISEDEQKQQGYDKFKWSVASWQIKCNNRKINLLDTADYDEDGRVLSENLRRAIQGESMMPDSVFDALHEKVCTKRKYNEEGKSDGLFTW